MCVCVCVCVCRCDYHVCCSLDDSGRWGKGGLFSALSSRSLRPQSQYELAGQMKDLTLGDAHFIPIDDLMQRDVGSDMVGPSFQVHVCAHVYMQ